MAWTITYDTSTLYLQDDGTVHDGIISTITSISRTKSTEASIMTMPMSDEADTMIMYGLGGTSGKYNISGTAHTTSTDPTTAKTDAHGFISDILTFCNATQSSAVTLHDDIMNSDVTGSIVDVGLEIKSGDVYIIQWKISFQIGTVVT